jgi:hypothetical protein
MFVRFVVTVRHSQSHRRMGVFHAADSLLAWECLDFADAELLRNLLAWFNRHLPIPRRFARSRRPHSPGKALSWFRAEANAYVDRVRQLAALLSGHGLTTQMLRTKRPGFVVYEDAYQVVAIPFRETRA